MGTEGLQLLVMRRTKKNDMNEVRLLSSISSLADQEVKGTTSQQTTTKGVSLAEV
jgi:hypothetical protein